MKPVHIRQRHVLERKIPIDTVLTLKMLREIGLGAVINGAIVWDHERWKVAPGDLAELMVLVAMSDLRVPLYQLADRLKEVHLSYFYDGEIGAEGQVYGQPGSQRVQKIA